MARKALPRDVELEVLRCSRRRCALCFGLNGDAAEKRGQIAHLDRDHSNHSLDNLCFLCLPHHDEYDSRTSQSKGLQPAEVKEYRRALYDRMRAMTAEEAPVSAKPYNLFRDLWDEVYPDDSYKAAALGRHYRWLTEIADECRLSDGGHPVIKALHQAKSFVHFAVADISQSLLCTLLGASADVHVRGIVPDVHRDFQEFLERAYDVAWNYNLAIVEEGRNLPEILVVDGLLAFTGAIALDSEEAGMPECTSDLDEVARLHNSGFSPIWKELCAGYPFESGHNGCVYDGSYELVLDPSVLLGARQKSEPIYIDMQTLWEWGDWGRI